MPKKGYNSVSISSATFDRLRALALKGRRTPHEQIRYMMDKLETEE